MGKYYANIIPDIEISKICTDTKDVVKDSVFVCLKGTKEDGHKYAQKAQENGAAVVIAQRALHLRIPLILTDDTKEALVYILKRFYPHPHMQLFAVTGTNGKTTTSHMIQSILNKAGQKCAVVGTNGVLFKDFKKDLFSAPTTPSLAELYKILYNLCKMGATSAVLEVSSHSLDQDRIKGLNFSSSAFTNLTHDHLDYHKTMENYFNAKRKLIIKCPKAAINADDEYGKRLLKDFDTALGYGILNGGLKAEDIIYSQTGSVFLLNFRGEQRKVSLKLPGEFNVYNALAAAGVCLLNEISIDTVKQGLESIDTIKGRMENVYKGDFNVFIDYAHTPDGLEKVLKTLKKITKGRVICLFGCGGDRDRTKRPEMAAVAKAYADILVITSDNPREEDPIKIINDILYALKSSDYTAIENRKDAIKYALSIAKKGDAVLLAGKGQEEYQIIGREKRYFNEREIVLEYTNLL